MHETTEDVEVLQRLLDDSYDVAGAHLRRIHTAARRLSAAQVVDRLRGMILLVLATVGPDRRPLTGPVDGLFYQGSLYFGTDPDSVRWRHLTCFSSVSATHLPGEDWAVVVHGDAVPVDIGRREAGGLRGALLEIYVPRYGERWEEFLDSGPVYARIEARRMFALDVTAAGSDYSDRGLSDNY